MLKKKTGIGFSKIDTIVAGKVVIKGDIRSEGSMRIDGTVEGRIDLKGDLIIGENGLVKGQMALGSVQVAGTVLGDIKARGKVRITSTGSVLGDVEADSFVVEEGAKFQGTSKKSADTDEKVKLNSKHPRASFKNQGSDTKSV